MGTILDKLNYLNSTKTAIKNAIIAKGGTVGDNDTFRDYVTDITNIVSEDTIQLKALIQGDCENFIIPNGTTSIRRYAFYNYSNPLRIIMPDSVTTLSSQCFMNCTGLISVTFSNNITNIPTQAFSSCSSLTEITIPNSVTTMEYGAFMGCSNLVSATLSDNLTIIPMQAFSQCSKLTSINIPNSVTTIEGSVFSYSNAITTINIPSSVTTINSNAFYSCGLTSIYIDQPNNGVSGAPWGASNATVYWNDGTKREPSLDDIFG